MKIVFFAEIIIKHQTANFFETRCRFSIQLEVDFYQHDMSARRGSMPYFVYSVIWVLRPAKATFCTKEVEVWQGERTIGTIRSPCQIS